MAFTRDILAAARQARVTRGLYIGCGNGRNYLPLVDGGLDLTGLDISSAAITQLTAPALRTAATTSSAETSARCPLRPSTRWSSASKSSSTATAPLPTHIRAAQQRVSPGGLFCLRVNATATDVHPRHEVTEHDPGGGFTVRYLTGSKQGLHIRFFTSAELGELFAAGFTPVLAPRVQQTRRDPPPPGQWSQWEAIWRKKRSPAAPDRAPLARRRGW